MDATPTLLAIDALLSSTTSTIRSLTYPSVSVTSYFRLKDIKLLQAELKLLIPTLTQLRSRHLCFPPDLEAQLVDIIVACNAIRAESHALLDPSEPEVGARHNVHFPPPRPSIGSSCVNSSTVRTSSGGSSQTTTMTTTTSTTSTPGTSLSSGTSNSITTDQPPSSPTTHTNHQLTPHIIHTCLTRDTAFLLRHRLTQHRAVLAATLSLANLNSLKDIIRVAPHSQRAIRDISQQVALLKLCLGTVLGRELALDVGVEGEITGKVGDGRAYLRRALIGVRAELHEATMGEGNVTGPGRGIVMFVDGLLRLGIGD